MALITCHECKKQFSSDADKCPHCGAKRKSTIKTGCGFIVVGFAALLVIFIVIGSMIDTPSEPPPAKAVRPEAKRAPDVSFALSATEIEITNDSTTPWPEMVIYLNDIPGGFKYQGLAPAVGAKVRLQLSQFVDKKGSRYNPALHGVVSIWIGGSGRDFQLFNVK